MVKAGCARVCLKDRQGSGATRQGIANGHSNSLLAEIKGQPGAGQQARRGQRPPRDLLGRHRAFERLPPGDLLAASQKTAPCREPEQ